MASMYEVTFKGEAGPMIRAAFVDLAAETDHGVTVLRGALADQAALVGVIQRVQSLGLELVDVRLVVEPAPEQ